MMNYKFRNYGDDDELQVPVCTERPVFCFSPTMQGFKYFQPWLRGKEELLLTVVNEDPVCC